MAKAHGFSLHAGVSCEAHQRELRERLCRYIARPAVAEQRLTVNAHGKVVYLLKTPYRDGTTHVVFEPLDFIARLAALVPRPRVNLTRYHGVLAPNHRWRAEVTPAGRGRRKGAAQPERCHRAPRSHDLGPTAEARLQHRRGELCALRQGREGHRRYRGTGADRTDPGARAGKGGEQRGITRPAVDGTAGECESGEHGQCANRGAGKLRSGIGRGRCCAGARYGGVSQRCVRRQAWAIG